MTILPIAFLQLKLDSKLLLYVEVFHHPLFEHSDLLIIIFIHIFNIKNYEIFNKNLIKH